MPKWVQLPAFKEDFERSGLDAETLALKAGVSRSTVVNWLCNSKTPSDKRKRLLASILKVDPHRYIDMPTLQDPQIGEVGRFQIEQARAILSDPRFTNQDRQELVDELKSRAKWMLGLKERM